VNGPQLVIVLRFEAGPQIYVDTSSDWEAGRLRDWICSHEELADLLDQALMLREAWLHRQRSR
jgi:hypothetical protein